MKVLPEGLQLGNDADKSSSKTGSYNRLKSKGLYMKEAQIVYTSTKYEQITL